jgi:hypothetical protein
MSKSIEAAIIAAEDMQEVIYNFTQRAFIGGDIKKVPFDQSKTYEVMSLLNADSLSQADLAMLPVKIQRVIYELLTQYIMFVSMNPQLLFPPRFLQGSNENQLGAPLLSYIRENQWPFPQMLK